MSRRNTRVELIIGQSTTELAHIAADIIVAEAEADPHFVLGLATGSSPEALYRELARRTTRGDADLSKISAFALDEYVGLAEDDPRRYSRVLHTQVSAPLGLDPTRVHLPPVTGIDVEQACEEFETSIAAAGGVGLQLLGIGANGHIGFNEPGSPQDSRTRMTRLSPQTRADNARFFDSAEDVPEFAVTQGIATILGARRIVLLAQGASKAAAVAAALNGPVSTHCPASALQLHGRVTLVLDDAAAELLSTVDPG